MSFVPTHFVVGGYTTDNFLTIAEEVGFTKEDVYQICCNAFNATFISQQDKEIISDVFSSTNGRWVMLLDQET